MIGLERGESTWSHRALRHCTPIKSLIICQVVFKLDVKIAAGEIYKHLWGAMERRNLALCREHSSFLKILICFDKHGINIVKRIPNGSLSHRHQLVEQVFVLSTAGPKFLNESHWLFSDILSVRFSLTEASLIYACMCWWHQWIHCGWVKFYYKS